ncbi:regulator of molybdate uptake [Sorangium cellulosum]|uniref:Regulator of molybdate uptake n=1 Tax=Sorangium cellulosum TaxID=56 RepID=A0A2L0ESD5_SORCE|nr:substrate-binding domain-containing protein [Sorangium cellulosum]AUX42211.1 regulator of molybdate uptake [Sorangium cellulosum]
MTAAAGNRVRALREQRGLSQVDLAAAASLTRQSVGAIEAGRATPSVLVALRLARALDCRVEDLFEGAAAAERVAVEPESGGSSGRVAIAYIARRWVSYPLDRRGVDLSADALASRSRRGRASVELLRPASDARENVVVMGCAPALGLLADRLNRRRGPGRFLWLARSSTQALEALSRDRTHVAGVHLVDDRTGEENLPDVRRHVGSRSVALVALAHWEAGLLVAPGNPHRIRGVADLDRPGLRIVGREPGSGARRLLDSELRRAGLPASVAAAAAVQASGPLEVAQAIAMGAADVGFATRDAAMAFHIEFVPLAEERFDLALPSDGLDDPRLARLFDAMTSSAFRRELSALGYDVRASGQRVATLNAAP